MSVPTPASLKAQIDKKKSESSAASASTKTDSARSSSPKKPFVRPEHLTQRPFKDNEALRKLASPARKSTTKKDTSKARVAAAAKRQKDREAAVKTAHELKDKGMSNVAIGKQMGLAESTVRGLLNSPVKNTNKENN